ncbi:hypothetical protein RQP46_002070 [Phenoliferia psychrophenolica]
MFGAPQPQSTFGGFGAPAASQPAASTSLFGATPAPSLFGTPAAAKPAGLSLFGAASKPPAPLGMSSGLFPSQTGLFPSQTPAPAAGGGMFGGLVGASSSAPKPFSFLGAAAPAPAAPAPLGQLPVAGQQQQQQQGAISKRTKWDDLPEQTRNFMELIQASITSQTDTADALKRLKLGGEIEQTKLLHQQCLEDYTAVRLLLEQDDRDVRELRKKIDDEELDMHKITTLVDGAKSPQTKGQAAKAVANFPFEFFSRKAEEFQEKLRLYKATMEQIHAHLQANHESERDPAMIVPTLKTQCDSMLHLASVVATLHNELKTLKDDYRTLWREKKGSVLDPFTIGKPASGRIETAVERMAIR